MLHALTFCQDILYRNFTDISPSGKNGNLVLMIQLPVRVFFILKCFIHLFIYASIHFLGVFFSMAFPIRSSDVFLFTFFLSFVSFQCFQGIGEFWLLLVYFDGAVWPQCFFWVVVHVPKLTMVPIVNSWNSETVEPKQALHPFGHRPSLITPIIINVSSLSLLNGFDAVLCLTTAWGFELFI